MNVIYQNKVIGTVDTINEFMNQSWIYNTAYVKDELGFIYFNDGTGLGFRACKKLYKDLLKPPTVTFSRSYKGSIYDQNNPTFYSIIRNVKDITNTINREQAYQYINQLRKHCTKAGTRKLYQ
jgi:hypothetical protein